MSPTRYKNRATSDMQLRFRVNQAAAFRQGINVPKSIVTIEVDAAAVPQEERDLIADRMHGIDVCEGVLDDDGQIQPKAGNYAPLDWKPNLIEAVLPTYEGLIEAVRKDSERLRQELTKMQPRLIARRSLEKFQAEHLPESSVKESEPEIV